MKTKSFAGICGAVLFLALLNTVVASAQEPVATVEGVVVKGKKVPTAPDFNILRASDKKWISGHQGAKIFDGDEIKTGSAQIIVRYADGSGESILQTRTHLRFQLPKGKQPKGLTVVVGEAFSKVKGQFSVVGAGVNGAVEGTEFNFQVSPHGSRLVVLEGAVRYGSAKKSVTLARLNVSESSLKAVPSAPKKASLQEIEKIITWTTAVRLALTTEIKTEAVFASKQERDKAFQRFYREIVINPNNAEARRGLADVYLDWGDLAAAMEHYSRALTLNPNDAMAHNNIGIIHIQKRDFPNAITSLQKAVELNPKSSHAPRTLNNLGTSFEQVGQHPKAISAFKEAIKLNPQNPTFYNNLGLVHFKLHETDQALALFEKAIQVDSSFVPARNNLGQLYLQRREFRRAVETFQAALTLEPPSIALREGLGNAHLGLKDFSSALSVLQRGIEQNPEAAPLHNSMGNVYYEMGQLQLALTSLQNAVKFHPGYAPAWQNLGNVYIRTGNIGSAIDAYRNATKNDLENPSYLVALSNAYLQQKDYKEATNIAQRAVRLAPDLPLAHRALGNAYLGGGIKGQALAEFTRIIELEPRDLGAYRNASGIAYEMKRFDVAINVGKKGLTYHPDNPELHYNLAIAYLQKGDYEEAMASYQKALGHDREKRFVGFAIQDLEETLKETPHPSFSQLALGILYEAQDNRERALHHLKTFLQTGAAPEWKARAQERISRLEGSLR